MEDRALMFALSDVVVAVDKMRGAAAKSMLSCTTVVLVPDHFIWVSSHVSYPEAFSLGLVLIFS